MEDGSLMRGVFAVANENVFISITKLLLIHDKSNLQTIIYHAIFIIINDCTIRHFAM